MFLAKEIILVLLQSMESFIWQESQFLGSWEKKSTVIRTFISLFNTRHKRPYRTLFVVMDLTCVFIKMDRSGAGEEFYTKKEAVKLSLCRLKGSLNLS